MDTENNIYKIDNEDEKSNIRNTIKENMHKKLENKEIRYKGNESSKTFNFKNLIELKDKLKNNNATILKSDKTNTPVIMFIDDYNRKVQEYINQNGYTEIKDPTNKYKKLWRIL